MREFLWIVAAGLAAPALADPVEEAEIREVLEVLASDEFEGRAPGTEGGRKTLHYLATKWHEAGLVGGARDGGWYEPAILVSSRPAVVPIVASHDGRVLDLGGKSAMIIGSHEGLNLRDVPVVYAGYGIDASGHSLSAVEGKIALMLGNPAPYLASDLPANNALARAQGLLASGAAAVVVVLPTGVPFEAVVGSLTQGTPRVEGTEAPNQMPDGATYGIIDADYFSSLAQMAGSDADTWHAQAGSGDFTPVTSGLATDLVGQASAPSRNHYFNVVGKLPGTDPSLAAIAIGGHWDGYGICRPEGAEDRICNGAVDNASGLAAITALADDVVEEGPYLRDLLFIGFTMEEKGLWGARAMAANPPQDIAVLFNVDTIATTDKLDRIAVIGRGTYKMDEAVLAAVMPMGYELNETQKYINRQDGATFAQAGIPAYVVSVNWGDMESFDEYVEKGPYHKPGDDISQVKMGAAVADANLHITLLKQFGNAPELPEGKIDQ